MVLLYRVYFYVLNYELIMVYLDSLEYIFDIGMGIGEWVIWIVELFLYCEVVGIDIFVIVEI